MGRREVGAEATYLHYKDQLAVAPDERGICKCGFVVALSRWNDYVYCAACRRRVDDCNCNGPAWMHTVTVSSTDTVTPLSIV